MGNQLVIVVLGMMIIVGIFVYSLKETGNSLTGNASASYAENTAREINNAAIDLAMRTLADSLTWRSTLSPSLSGGYATVTFKDTVVGKDTAVVVRSQAKYNSGNDSSTVKSLVVVMPADGFVPLIIRDHGAFTAFGPIDDAISDMYIDGRNWRYDAVTISPSSGVYAVSTGESTFVAVQRGELGGTTYVTPPATDITPSFPFSPLVVETSAPWPLGWPTTPDAALGIPQGYLKDVAVRKL